MADAQYWKDATHFVKRWDKRASLVAALIPTGSWVCDIGCGPRQPLKDALREGCEYLPADLMAWNPGVEPCDLNAGKLPLRSIAMSDTIVVLGVLEYLDDPIAAVAKLALFGAPKRLIISYHPKEYAGLRRHDRISAKSIDDILKNGGYYVSHYRYRRRQIIFVATKDAPTLRERIYSQLAWILRCCGIPYPQRLRAVSWDHCDDPNCDGC